MDMAEPARATMTARPAHLGRGRERILAFVMAGGAGKRLQPLTIERCKPAVPFNGKHRIVDFVLSNLVNSEICSIYLLVQYKSQALIEHVRQSWSLANLIPDQFITVVPPQMSNGEHWFRGTADAVYQNIELIERFKPDLVVVFGADHVYRMDVRQMVQAHLERRADVTVAALPVPVSMCGAFGIIETDDQLRITQFREKPASAAPAPGRPGYALASMGNYLFTAEVLLDVLRDAQQRGEFDFGQHLLPRLARTHAVFAYDFLCNHIPGQAAYEEPGYWRDVGTIDAYFAAHLDTLGVRPRFRMSNPQWPIHASPDQAESAQIEGGTITRSVLGTGCIVDHACLDHAMLRRDVQVASDATLDHCIVMDRAVIGRGARVHRAIIDQDNHVPAHEVIGFDSQRDRRFHVSEGGIVVVPRGYFPRHAHA